MKANELMIGDWVMAPDDYPVMVSTYYLPFYLSYEPIPLTEEILEKNGFERSYNTYMLGDFRLGIPNQYSPFNVKEEYYILDIARNRMPIQYVHELQHALRLCGLTDLANNFNV